MCKQKPAPVLHLVENPEAAQARGAYARMLVRHNPVRIVKSHFGQCSFKMQYLFKNHQSHLNW
jgi:hypothetical protein